MKKCSPSLAIKEMQIKTTLTFHITLVRIGRDAQGVGWGTGTLIHCWWKWKLVQPL
jgi:hypothetical protein